MSATAKETLMNYAIIDAARDYTRIALAEHCCIWSESLFSGEKGADLDDVAPHLYICDFEGTVAWLTLRGFQKGEAGILLESSLPFKKLRKELRKRLSVWREQSKRRAFFRFYDPRVLRTFLPSCTPEELEQFFGPIDAFHCQGMSPVEVLSFTLHDRELQVAKSNIDDFLVAKDFCTQKEMDEAAAELKQMNTDRT